MGYFTFYFTLYFTYYFIFHFKFTLLYFTLLYLPTPWTRVYLEKLTSFQLVKKFPAFCGTQKFHYGIHKYPPPVSILCHIDPVQALISHCLKFYLNIVLPSRPGSSKCSLSLFPNQNYVHTSPLSHTCYMDCQSHSSRFDHTQNIGWVQIIKLLIM